MCTLAVTATQTGTSTAIPAMITSSATPGHPVQTGTDAATFLKEPILIFRACVGRKIRQDLGSQEYWYQHIE